MFNSILKTVREMIVGCEDDASFDNTLIVDINTALSTLTQVGLGPPEGFRIQDESSTWDDLIGDFKNLDMVKSYVHLKVKNLFDPSASSIVAQAQKEELAENLWRIEDAVSHNEKKMEAKMNGRN